MLWETGTVVLHYWLTKAGQGTGCEVCKGLQSGVPGPIEVPRRAASLHPAAVLQVLPAAGYPEGAW